MLPDQPGSHPHLLVLGGNSGKLYVVDRDQLGGFHSGSDSHAVQTFATAASVFGAAAYWNGYVFMLWSDDVLKDFALRNGRLSAQPGLSSRCSMISARNQQIEIVDLACKCDAAAIPSQTLDLAWRKRRSIIRVNESGALEIRRAEQSRELRERTWDSFGTRHSQTRGAPIALDVLLM